MNKLTLKSLIVFTLVGSLIYTSKSKAGIQNDICNTFSKFEMGCRVIVCKKDNSQFDVEADYSSLTSRGYLINKTIPYVEFMSNGLNTCAYPYSHIEKPNGISSLNLNLTVRSKLFKSGIEGTPSNALYSLQEQIEKDGFSINNCILQNSGPIRGFPFEFFGGSYIFLCQKLTL